MVNAAQYCTLLTNCRVPWDRSILSGPGPVPVLTAFKRCDTSGLLLAGTAGTAGTAISHSLYRKIYIHASSLKRNSLYIYVPYIKNVQTAVPAVPYILKPLYINTYSWDRSIFSTGPERSQKIRNLPISVLTAVSRAVPANPTTGLALSRKVPA